MAEETTQDTTTEDQQAESMLADATVDAQGDLGEGGKKALDAERKARRSADRELKTLRSKVQEFEDRDKTEGEKLTQRLTAAEQKATAAEQAQLKLDVALDKAPEGLSLAQVRKLATRLSGASREELETDAADLFADIPASAPAGNGRRPVETLRSGSAAAGGDAPGDMNEWMRGRTARR